MESILQSGSFVSAGLPVRLNIRSSADFMWVYNYTQAGTTQTPGRGVQFYWQNGMAPDTGIKYTKTDATSALNITTLANGGFTLFDNSVSNPGALVATTAISGATPPLVATASTAGLANGSVVRIINQAGAFQLSGLDFTVNNVTANTSFALQYAPTIAATALAGGYRIIPFADYFYPRYRYISAITKAVNAVVTMTVTSGFTVGQDVRLVVPAVYGMREANGLEGTILAVDNTLNTITLDIDSTGFTAFVFPLTTAVPFSPAIVVPVGEDTAASLSINAAQVPLDYNGVQIFNTQTQLLADAEVNTAFIGMSLAVGAQAPAGSTGDVIYWVAGKSSLNNGQ